jgi:hypothetical protein
VSAPTPDPKSYRERLDPGGELHQQMSFFKSPVGRLLARLTGAEGDLKALADQYETLMTQPARIAAALGPLGWIFFGDADVPVYAAAAALVEERKLDEAEQLLVEHWNDEPRRLETPLHRIFSLYGIEPEWAEIRDERQRLLGKALEYHRAGEFAASVPILIAQTEGIFVDFTGKESKEFFNPRNPELEDDETLAGHPAGLRALSQLMSRGVKRSGKTGGLRRHAIVHGQELGYDTIGNSTKIWVGLLAVIEAMKPRADRINADLKAAREAQLAGSKELDSDGRMLDRRGFDTAKMALFDLNTAQCFHYAATRRYTTDRGALQTARPLKPEDIEVETADDGQEYWAWIVTPPGMVFGVAARRGNNPIWFYSADRVPSGGIDSDSEWRHAASDPAAPEW